MDAACRRNPDIAWRTVEGHCILIHNTLGEVMVLNEIGTYVWEHVEEGMDAVVDGIVENYEVEPETARIDVQQFIDDLMKSDLLQRG